MPIPSWPADLPQNILAQGFKGGLPNNQIRTNMDVGPAQVRRRGTVAVEPVTGNILCTPTELALFKTFYETTLLDGSLRFKWKDPLVDGMTRLESTLSGVTGIVETADGMAFVDPMTDISEYDGKRIDVIDTADKIASGYIHRSASDAPFVQMSYAASGSTGITVADNDNIDFGTGNFTLAWKGSLPDWTPDVNKYLFWKYDSFRGYNLRLNSAGKIALGMYRNDTGIWWTSTAASTLTDGTEHEIVAVVTRETALSPGSVIFYVDGVQLGASVEIVAAATETVSNTGILYISGYPGVRNASTNEEVQIFNRALSTAEVLSLYQNGIAEADKWGNQTAVYTSDFSAGVDGWVEYVGGGGGVVLSGNVDSIDGEDNCLKALADGASRSFQIAKSNILTAFKKFRIRFDYWADSGSGLAYWGIGVGGARIDSTGVQIVEGSWQSGEIEFTNGDFTRLTLTAFTTSTGSTVDQLATGKSVYFRNIVVTQLGATLALEPSGIALANWQDASSNNLDASYPATGCSVYPAGTGVRITSTENGSSYNFSSIDDGFGASGTHTMRIYDYLEMRFTEPPTWSWVDGYFKVVLPLEILK